MKEISCNIIRDLLPLYVDGVVSDDTSELVESHLAECEECRKEAERIKEHLSLPDSCQAEEAEARVIKDFGKEFRKRSRINALKAAGLSGKGITTHKLRHTAATLMYQYGQVDIRALQELLGHQSISTTEIYTHVDNEQVRNAVESNPLANFKVK